MKKQFYLAIFLVGALLTGCSKSDPEPEPAEQIIGSYDVQTISISVDGVVVEGYELPAKISDKDASGNTIQIELTQTLEVAKKSMNVVTIVSTTNEKDLKTGKVTTSRDPFDDIELKKNSAGTYDMIDTKGKAVGTASKDDLNFAEESDITDSGKVYKVKYSIKAKRKV